MASGTQNLTTYVAKRIIGDSTNVNWAGALLHSGTGGKTNTMDTWIFANDYKSAYGILHRQSDDKIVFVGDSTDKFWINLNTGDSYILGNMGIGYDPETSGNTYKLYVNGTTRINSILHIFPTNGDSAGGTTFIGAGYIDLVGSTPYIDFHHNNDSSDYTFRLITVGDGLKLISKESTNCWLYIGNGTDTAGIYWQTFGGGIYMDDSKWLKTYNSKPVLISIGTNNAYGIGGHRLALGLQGGSHVSLMLLVSSSVGYGLAANSNGNWYFGKRTSQSMESTTGDAYIYYGNETLFAPYTNNSVNLGDDTHRWKTVQSYSNITASQGNIWAGTAGDTTAERDIGVASGAGTIYMYSAAATNGNRGIWLSAHGSGGGKNVFLVDTNNNVTFYGTLSGNATSASQCSSANLTDIALTWSSSYSDGDYMLIHNGETGANGGQLFRAINKANTAAWVDSAHKWVRLAGDTMTGNLVIRGTGDKYFEVNCTDTGCRVELDNSNGKHGIWSSGYWNGSAYKASALWMLYRHTDGGVCCGTDFSAGGLLYTSKNGNTVAIGSQNSGFCHIYNSTAIPFIFNNTVCTTAGDLGNASYPFGNLVLKSGGRVSGNGGALYLGNSSNANWVLIADCCAQAGSAYWKIYSGSGEATFKKVYNAVWNDYAECREVEIEEPGYCVTETKSGKMIKTTKRLQAGCKIISDTFGTCMGETETAKTPIAVAGRVLVYPYRAREEYTLGAAVCSAPDGMVDIMSRDEIMMYPERIVGTVSEIPTYDIWNGGISKDPDPISVNGRIWIYVK